MYVYALDLENLKGKKYGNISIFGNTYLQDAYLLQFLGIRRGEEFSYFHISLLTKKLYRMGIYQDVRVKYEIEEDYVNLEILLKEKKVLERIYIRPGNMPFRKKRILEKLHLHEGKLVSETDIEFAVNGLYERLKDSGIYDIDFNYRINTYEDRLFLIIFFESVKYNKISDIILQGTTEDFKKRFESIKKAYKGMIISQMTMNDIEYSLGSLLSARGYREARVIGREIVPIGDNISNIVFNIALNDRYAIDITGNEGLSTEEIINNVPHIIDFVNNPDEPDYIKEFINRFYHNNGYFSMESEVNVREVRKDFFVLEIAINEGDRYRVRDVFVRVDGVFDQEVKQFLDLASFGFTRYPYYTKSALDRDLDIIKKYYTDRGYLDVSIKYDLDYIHSIKHVVIHFMIERNEKYFVEDFKISSNIRKENIKYFESLRSKYIRKPYSPRLLMEMLDTIYHYYLTRGYIDLDARISVEEGVTDPQGKILRLEIYEGQIYQFGNIIFSGRFRLNEDILYDHFTLGDDPAYDSSKLFTLRQELYNSGFFKYVYIDEFDHYISMMEKDIIVHLEEAKFGNAFVSLGFDTKEKFRTQSQLKYLNIGGYGTDLLLGLKYSSVEERYNIRFSNKYVFKNSNIMLDIFREAFVRDIRDEEIHGLSLIYSRLLAGTNYKYDIGYEFKNIKSHEDDYKSSIIGSMITTVSYDSRDDMLFPRSGSLFICSLKYADTFFFSKNEFLRIYSRGTKYFPVSSKNVFVLSGQTGFIFPIHEQDTVPYSERFFLGGRLTMRGFERNAVSPHHEGEPFGGNSMFLLNAELRIDFSYGFGLILFFDAGNVWDTYKNYDVLDLRTDAGIGFFYNTPIGPVRLDIGYNLSPIPGENKGQYFFNFGHPF